MSKFFIEANKLSARKFNYLKLRKGVYLKSLTVQDDASKSRVIIQKSDWLPDDEYVISEFFNGNRNDYIREFTIINDLSIYLVCKEYRLEVCKHIIEEFPKSDEFVEETTSFGHPSFSITVTLVNRAYSNE